MKLDMQYVAPETLKSMVYRAKARLEKGKEVNGYLPDPEGIEELKLAVDDAIRILEGN
jgi:hypothetical protein